jgi:biopolymer transport protein ExbD
VNFRSTKRDDVELNITPLIDVVFLLLIFFMVSTSFIRQSEISLTLPQASEERPARDLDVVNISIDRSGRFYVNGQALLNAQIGTIRDAIKEAAANLSGEPTIVINSDAGADVQAVVTVMDAARQLGFVRITFTTEVQREQ